MSDAELVRRRAAIRADIFSDEPRIALATAYEARGDLERGEFIRLQVERAKLPWWRPEVARLEIKEWAILERRENEWRSELPTEEGIKWGPFRGGLVGSAMGDLTALGGANVEAAALSSIALQWPSAREREVPLNLPDSVHELTVVGTVMGPDDMAWLGGLPALAPLRRLSLLDSQLSLGLPRLLRSRHLQALESLCIPFHHLGTKGLERIFKAKLPALRELVLPCAGADQFGSGRRYRAPIDDVGAYALALWPGYTRLESLDLSGGLLGVGGLTALLGSPLARGLRKLRLRDIADGDWEMDDSLTAFQFGPSGALEELDIGDNDLNEQAAHALASAPALRSLKALTLNKVKTKHLAILAAAPWFQDLEYLHCDATALPALLSGTARLGTLKVAADSKTGHGISSALEGATLESLQVLDLDDTKLSGDALGKLGEVARLPALLRITAVDRRARFSGAEAGSFMSSTFASSVVSVRLGLESDRLPGPHPLRLGSSYVRDGIYEGSERFL